MILNRHTALYCRLSKDDANYGESTSIKTQKLILEQYALDHKYYKYEFYIDDGYSGVNFERPEFERLIQDVKNGLVERVIVKDLSRFGRNYILVGEYVELLFPKYDVQFVSVSENMDSEQGNLDMMPINNLVNEWYARDISKKQKASVKARGNNGKRLTTKPIFGYAFDPADHSAWIIDETAAAVIRIIFDMYVSGKGLSMIAKYLKEHEVPTPKVYANENAESDEPYNWSHSTLKSLLSKQEYCGDTVNFRSERVSYKCKKIRSNPPEKWVIFRDTHPAIISRETYDKAQEIIGQKRKVFEERPKLSVPMFHDVLYCADCGKKLYIIFDMYVNGTGILEISRVLTAEKIPRPTAHMKFKTGVRCDDFEEYFWHPSSVRNILRRQEYCGDTVNFRTTRLSYKSHKIVWNPKEKLRIFENTHEAIISREVYERAQEMLGEPRKVPRTGERALYYDYLYCEECKHTMRIRNRAANADQKSYFCTLAHKKRGACDLHNIAEVVLNDYVMEQINKLLVFAKTDRDGFEKMMKDKCDGSILAESETTEARIEQIKARLSEIDVYVQGLFESKIRGEIDGDMFCTFSEKYRTEKSELNTELENLFLTLQNIKKKTSKSAVLGTSVNKYDTISEVTSEVLRDFIEHIEVGEYTGERKFRKKVRKIRIFFIGIGEVHFD